MAAEGILGWRGNEGAKAIFNFFSMQHHRANVKFRHRWGRGQPDPPPRFRRQWQSVFSLVFLRFSKNEEKTAFKARLQTIESEVFKAVWTVGKGETGCRMFDFEGIEKKGM